MDTPLECLNRATADDIAAEASSLPNQRSRLTQSAFAWRLRAELLERQVVGPAKASQR